MCLLWRDGKCKPLLDLRPEDHYREQGCCWTDSYLQGRELHPLAKNSKELLAELQYLTSGLATSPPVQGEGMDRGTDFSGVGRDRKCFLLSKSGRHGKWVPLLNTAMTASGQRRWGFTRSSFFLGPPQEGDAKDGLAAHRAISGLSAFWPPLWAWSPHFLLSYFHSTARKRWVQGEESATYPGLRSLRNFKGALVCLGTNWEV